MTFDQMTTEYATYVQDDRAQEQYATLLDHMFQAAGEDAAAGFHERTINRLASTSEPVIPEQVEQSDDADAQ